MSGSGGGNRQDNRQRGNAAQLLEKYKSMARDAQLAGDRVQTEYYLQFADHYYRVLGDSRVRFDEQRRGRDEDGDGDEDEGVEMNEADADRDNDREAAEAPQRRRPRDRDERPERAERQNYRNNGDARDQQDDGETGERIAFDVLPPAIGAQPDAEESRAEQEPRPRRRTRRPRAEDGEAEIAPAA